ncbi:hypothetical protein [Microbulbifer taiwanensis]|uniref:DUF1440 domain-containing protein n=1 Tax=Microbulbifer taiwanensis TaxID=986746 RepID=A0ABW1YRR3_9GAMM|nr:hypothetical protein [Microbulbifer taiwanensis]
MNQISVIKIAVYAGIGAALVGLIAFIVNWTAWGGGMPGYRFFLFPGNLTLVYIWHPLFTEEIDFWPKLAIHILGQFTVVSLFTALITAALKRLPRFLTL